MKIIMAVILLTGLVLLNGACAAKPTTGLFKVVIVDSEEEWTPSAVTVSVGGVVTWSNNGNTRQHSVISDQELFNASLSPGQSFKYTFTHSGNFTFHDDPNISGGAVYVK